MTDRPKSTKTLAQRPSSDTMIKPGELIDIVEMTPLTLADRRTYNMLLANAWDRLGAPEAEHVIALVDLRGNHESNDRLDQSIKRLMSAIVEVRIEHNGKLATRRVQLLGGNDMDDDETRGVLHYTFDPKLIAILRNSTVFGRLRTAIMFAFTSKYALALYEMGEKRRNMRLRWSEDFTVNELRGLLGVPKSKLTRFADLNAYCLKPAVAEVNALADFGVKLEPLKAGRKVTAIRMSWWRKNDEEIRAAFAELQRHRAGRKARIAGTVEATVGTSTSSLRRLTDH